MVEAKKAKLIPTIDEDMCACNRQHHPQSASMHPQNSTTEHSNAENSKEQANTQMSLYSSTVLHQARYQILIFAVVSMLIIGPYNALNALGGGGLKDHRTATKLNVVNTASQAAFGWISGTLLNYYGVRLVATCAGFFFLPYVAVLVAIAFFGAHSAWVFPNGIILGCGGALLWATFGLVSIRYATLKHQGRAFAFMWAILNLGGVVAGTAAIFSSSPKQPASASTSESYDHDKAAGITSYLIMGATILLGSLLACLLLRHQEKVRRSDGELAGNSNPMRVLTLWSSLREGLRVFGDQDLFLLWPTFLVPFAHLPFLFNGVNGQYFNIRSRGLNSTIYWASRIPGGFIFLFVVKENNCHHHRDLLQLKQCLARRLLPGVYATFLWAAWCLFISHLTIFNTFGNIPAPATALDFYQDSPKSLLPIIAFSSFGILDSLVQSLLYNALASMAGDDSNKVALYCGFYKGFQSLALSGFWALDFFLTDFTDLAYTTRYQIHWILMLVLWLVALPGILLRLLQLRTTFQQLQKELSQPDYLVRVTTNADSVQA